VSTLTGSLRHTLLRRPASAVFGALLTSGAIVVALGGLAFASPAAAAPLAGQLAQVVPTLAGSPAPPPQSTAVPGGIGVTRGSLVVGIESPQAGRQLHTDRDFLIVGHALDKSATVSQCVQGSGIDRVQVFMDIPPDATPTGNADLGFSDTTRRNSATSSPTAASD